MTNDVFAEMENDALNPEIPNNSKLEEIAKLVQEQVYWEKIVEENEELLRANKAKLLELQTRIIPAVMDEIGLSKITTANGDTLMIKPFVSAKIPKENLEEAHEWLRNNDFGDIIKHIVSVDVGKNEESATKAVTALSGLGLMPTDKESVHSSTLKAWLREQVEAGMSIPLELFGAYLGQKSTIKKG
jgi:hypothetical protein